MRPAPRVDVGERIVPFVGAAIMVAVAAAAAPAMPEPMTTSWGLAGPPRARLPQAGFLAISLVGWLFCWGWVWRSRRRQVAGRWGEVGWAYTSAAMILVGHVLTVVRNVGATSWDATGRGDIDDLAWYILSCILVYHALGLVRRRADARLPDPDDALVDDGEAPTAGLREGERVVWTAALRPGHGLGPLPVLAVWALTSDGDGAFWVLVLVATLASFDKLFRGRVTIDRRGVRLRTGLGATAIPLGEIREARVIWLPPTAYEGGLKFETEGDYRLRVLSASGAALFLDTTGGDVVITIPRAREAAGVVNDLRAAAGLTIVK